MTNVVLTFPLGFENVASENKCYTNNVGIVFVYHFITFLKTLTVLYTVNYDKNIFDNFERTFCIGWAVDSHSSDVMGCFPVQMSENSLKNQDANT